MSNVVFILGAGASRQCGAPLMNDFLETAFHLWKTNKVQGKQEHFERVFRARSALQVVHSKSQLDLNNIESIFTALEMANVLGKLPTFEPNEIGNVITSLKELIVATLEKTMSFMISGKSLGPIKPYNSFVDLISYLTSDANPKRSVSVITFNYDIALDLALHIENLGPDYCIGEPPKNPLATPLLKLHGSIIWASESETGAIIPLVLNQYFQRYRVALFSNLKTCTIPIGSQLQEFFAKQDIKVGAAPVIVPPTWNKTGYHQTLSKVWSRAAKELEDADNIFIIGYSLSETDAFFRLLYGLGTVGETPLHRLVVFNPDIEVKNRFFSILGPGAQSRFKFLPEPFSKATDRIKRMFP